MVTLGNNTNNRLEATWKQLKEWVHSFMSVDECITSMMFYQSIQERRFMSEMNKVVQLQCFGYDYEMTIAANLVSKHACELIHGQYAFAVGHAAYEFYEGCPGVYFIKSVCRDADALDELNAEYSVSKYDWTCSCMFMNTHLLPCRHVFYIRKSIGKDSIIPTQLLNSRWLLSSVRAAVQNDDAITSSPVESYAIRRVVVTDERPWDSNRKYREALPIATEICDTMAGLGMVQYREATALLEDVAKRIRKGDFRILDGHLMSTGVETTLVSSPTISQTNNASTTNGGDYNQSSVEHNQSGNQSGDSGELGNQSGDSGELSGHTARENAEAIENCDALPMALDLACDTNFHVSSPPRSRGRPKQTVKAKTASRKKEVVMALEDSELFAASLSFANV